MRVALSAIAALALLPCLGQPGHAQPAAPAPAPAPAADPRAILPQSLGDWLTQPTMTGDWGGLRTRLSQAGFDFRGSYVNDFADDFSGGKRIGGDFAQQFILGADVDLAKVADLTGASLHVTLSARYGRSTSADFIGNKLPAQNIYGSGENVRLAELSYEQYLLGKTLDFKVGFIILGNDFATTPILCSFQSDGFCSHPQSLPNDSGWSDSPLGKWGGRVRVNLPGDIYVQTGVYEVNPTNALHDNGFKLSLQGSTGAVIPFELGKTVKLGSAEMPGHYKLGAYYDTSEAPTEADPHAMSWGRYGGYFLADQMVWSFAPQTDRGLYVVGDATVSDAKTAPISSYFVAALIAQGPFAARPHDFVALGYARATVNRDAIRRNETLLAAEGVTDPMLESGENVAELGYGLQLAPWLLIHPNVQFIGDPGAFAFKHIADAWVFGTEVKVTF